MADLSRTCRITGCEFIISEAEQEHIRTLNRLIPALNGALPLPDIHPLESLRRISAFVNHLHLYRSQSAFSGTPHLTRYHPQLGTRICTPDEFWSEAFDNREFGRPYDFSRPFFDQWLDLYRQCYIMPLVQINCEASDYVNGALNVANSYLCFNIIDSRDCLYCFNHFVGSDNVTCVSAGHSEFCYACVNIESCYECQHCTDCVNASCCFGCSDLIGCHECFGCVGLRNVRFHIFNRAFTEQAYRRWREGRDIGDAEGRRQALQECSAFQRSENHTVNRLVNVENCSGDYLRNSHNAHACYFAEKLDECGYLLTATNCSHCWRSMSFNSEYSYESLPIKNSRSVYSYLPNGGEDNIYVFHTEQNCANCFGCVSLKNRSYCILNRQYTREEYLELVPRIIEHMKSTGEWGQFFPPRYAPHIYEHSLVSELFQPISEAEARRRGYRFEELPPPEAPRSSLRMIDLPSNIKEVTDEMVIGQSFLCDEIGQAYAVQKKELEFYRRFSIPLPRKHWLARIRRLARNRALLPDVLPQEAHGGV